MEEKEFKIRSTKTGEVVIVKGKNVQEATLAEGLNPDIWLPVED